MAAIIQPRTILAIVDKLVKLRRSALGVVQAMRSPKHPHLMANPSHYRMAKPLGCGAYTLCHSDHRQQHSHHIHHC